ncbi:MAG: hypothetical protein GY844_29940 [Bradyrhizobium sp.]|nr:hypothetical protein [Bradyrhizobium sp.]
MVKHHAAAAPSAARFRNPVKQAIWDSLEVLRRPELDQLEAKVDGLIADGIALAETREPGVLAAALVAWVDRWVPRVYEIPVPVTDGRDLLREWLDDSPYPSNMHTAITLA